MITLFNRGFMPVTSRLDSTVDKILKDPFWDEMDSFFHKPISNYHLDNTHISSKYSYYFHPLGVCLYYKYLQ